MAKQCYNDVLSILELDSAEEFSYAWDGSITQLYHDAEVAAAFIKIDVAELRAWASAVAIPPPGIEPQPHEQDQRAGDEL
eukprot:9260758-Pyramimonas_sp.AAC.1